MELFCCDGVTSISSTLDAEADDFLPGSACGHKATFVSYDNGIWKGELPAENWQDESTSDFELHVYCSGGNWVAKVWDLDSEAYVYDLPITNDPCADGKVIVDMLVLCNPE